MRIKPRFLITPLITLLLATVVMLLGSRARDSDAPLPPPDVSKMGVHLLLDDGRASWPVDLWADHMTYADQIVLDGGFVVQVIRADDLDPARWQHFMDLCAAFDLTPVLRLATTFDFERGWWRPPQADADGRYLGLAHQYAGFINALDWPTPQKHVIILNEPNNGHEWAGRPEPAAYARLLVDVSSVLRERVAGAVILNGALDLYAPDTGDQPFPDTDIAYMSAPRFLEAMVSAEPGVFAEIDLWNSHPYPLGAFREPPWMSEYGFFSVNGVPPIDEPVPDGPDGVANRGVNGYEWELWKLETLGIPTRPVFIGETGWRHSGGGQSSADAAPDDNPYPSPEQVSVYLDLALRGNPTVDTGDLRYPDLPFTGWTPWLRDERVVGVVVFALNGVPRDWDATNLLAMASDGSVRDAHPHFDRLRELIRE